MKSGLILVLLAASTSAFCQARRFNDWTIIGPGGGGTTIAPTIDPNDPRTVVEHCDMTGGYITHDDGHSWRMFSLRGGITTFAFDRMDPQRIYAGNAALWRSSDSGKTWNMLFPAPADHTVEHQLSDHSDYVLTSDQAAYPGGEVSAIAVDRLHSRRLYVAFYKAGASAELVTSADDGISWSRLATLPDKVALLQIDGDGVVAMSGATAYRVTPANKIMKLGHIAGDLAAASSGRSAGAAWLYATNRAGHLFVSRDGGRNWTAADPVLGQRSGRFEAIATSEEHPRFAYVGFRGLQLPGDADQKYNGIAKTTDGGHSWTVVFRESSHPAVNMQGSWIDQRASTPNENIWFDAPYSLGVAPTDPQVVYATDLFRTYGSLNGGTTWREMDSALVHGGGWHSRGLDVTTDYGVQFDPFNKRHMFIDYTDIGLFQSHDGGASWRGSSQGVPDSWRNTTYWLAFDPSKRGVMWGAFSGVHDLPRPKMWRNRSPLGYTGGVGISTDGGMHWTPSGTGMPPTAVTHILLDAHSPEGTRTLYATGFGRGVYKSTDNGTTWTLENNGIEEKEPLAWRLTLGSKGELYLVVARRSEGFAPTGDGDGALYRSFDRAGHWQRMTLPKGVNGPTALEIDPANDERLYLTAWGRQGTDADTGGGVYVSNDRGLTWTTLFTASQHVYDLTIDTHHPNILYICGFDAAAFRSTDSGRHWERVKGFGFKWGHRVIVDPVHPDMIYITTYGGGVWHGPADGGHDIEDVTSRVPVAQ